MSIESNKRYPLRRKLSPLVVSVLAFGAVALTVPIMVSHSSLTPDPKTGRVVELHSRSGKAFYVDSTGEIAEYGMPILVMALLSAWLWYVKQAPWPPKEIPVGGKRDEGRGEGG
jgi:hypothetical protein